MGASPNLSERRIFDYTLVKLAMRCNLDCTYCYWFRDRTVYERPPLLTEEAEMAYLAALERHVRRYDVRRFFILFHGGEPLLFGKRRFDSLCARLRELERRTEISLRLAVTTNGVLLDDDWVRLLRDHRVGVTLSIDGPKRVHDDARRDLRGRGTLDRTLVALERLRFGGMEPGVLAVCHPELDPEPLCEFFVNELQVHAFDFLVPDANHENAPPSIAAFYTRLFDLWYDRYADSGVRIRFLESLVAGLIGRESHSESIGYGPTSTVTLLTDGSLEPLDVLRTAGDGFTRTAFSVLRNELQDVDRDPLWQEVLHASLELSATCQACSYKLACGGGHIASRFSAERRYDNPSVYCADFKRILSHTWSRIQPDLYVETAAGPIPLRHAMSGESS